MSAGNDIADKVRADALAAGHDRKVADALAKAVTSKRAPYKPAASTLAPARAAARPSAPAKPAPRGVAAKQEEVGAFAASWWKRKP